MRGPKIDKDGIYYYRRRIPDDVRAALRELEGSVGGKQDKREEKRRLGRDPILASQLWAEHDRAVERRWAELRSRTTRAGLTVVEREALAGEIYRLWLDRLPVSDAGSGPKARALLSEIEDFELGERRGIAAPRGPSHDDWRSIDEFEEDAFAEDIDQLLAKRGLILSAIERAGVIGAVSRATKHACKWAIKRLGGEARPDREALRYPKWPDPETDTLSGLFRSWAATQNPLPDTERAFKLAIDKFKAFIRHEEVARIATNDVRRWCAHLKIVEKKGSTRIKNGYLAALKAVLNCAVQQGALEVSPCANIVVKAKPRPRTREKDLTDRETYAILRASLDPQGSAVSATVAATRRWIPWILAYTGARVAEITNLTSGHIIQEAGVWGFKIEKSKNGTPRKIPIHRDLIDQGFLDFVKSRDGLPLFFDRQTAKTSSIHKTRAEGLGDWVRRVTGNGPNVVSPNHGWRHRFKTECRRVMMNHDIAAYIQGHTFESVGDTYGHIPLDVTGPWMDLFPIYDVSGEELVVQRSLDPSMMLRAFTQLGLAASMNAVSRERAA
ncbi:hypothetical protein G8O24_26460 [Bradyrhizobium sp. INPA01-394B]|uniref:Core-binding (CB) domain-containing protein n=1 Tax=Bradyrhizobium campsiandrae TaxID=1729892 RepID=A0ABR7UA25_9BRAD|nr:hypothetical protein [Bradyrhizobium campsiandrae]MBC9880874.1 hypothetical protein [Bradyrhizobium campsiandrae]MBC9980292.1 hypothetical protein [Bradyrhizobium campsiandrae]